VQRQVNLVDDAITQVTSFIDTRPVISVLIAVGIGYVIGKVT
jgi:ElaB/YqjD/DUF883 family membrane-anchored ribosome-binding protein